MTNDNVIYRIISGNKNEGFIPGDKPVRFAQSGMFICTKGEVEILLDDNRFLCTENDIVVYFPFSVLKIIYASDDLYGFMMSVDVNVVQPLLTKITDVDSILNLRQNPVTKLSQANLNAINFYIELYQKHLLLSKQYAANNQRRFWQLNNLQIENVKMNLVLQIILAFTNTENKLKNTIDRRDDIVRKFLNDLRDNYVEQHDVTFYASRQFLSMRYFSSVVKMRTGQTPSQWIASVLIREAKAFLTDSNLTIKEISEKMNFPNQSYFGKWFKTHVGMGPLDFKKIEHMQ